MGLFCCLFRNPIDSCNSLNPLVLPEYAIHILINIFFLIAGEWTSLILNVPLIAYHVYKYKNRPPGMFTSSHFEVQPSSIALIVVLGMSGVGLYDPTNIMNSGSMCNYDRKLFFAKHFHLQILFRKP